MPGTGAAAAPALAAATEAGSCRVDPPAPPWATDANWSAIQPRRAVVHCTSLLAVAWICASAEQAVVGCGVTQQHSARVSILPALEGVEGLQCYTWPARLVLALTGGGLGRGIRVEQVHRPPAWGRCGEEAYVGAAKGTARTLHASRHHIITSSHDACGAPCPGRRRVARSAKRAGHASTSGRCAAARRGRTP